MPRLGFSNSSGKLLQTSRTMEKFLKESLRKISMKEYQDKSIKKFLRRNLWKKSLKNLWKNPWRKPGTNQWKNPGRLAEGILGVISVRFFGRIQWLECLRKGHQWEIPFREKIQETFWWNLWRRSGTNPLTKLGSISAEISKGVLLNILEKSLLQSQERSQRIPEGFLGWFLKSPWISGIFTYVNLGKINKSGRINEGS